MRFEVSGEQNPTPSSTAASLLTPVRAETWVTQRSGYIGTETTQALRTALAALKRLKCCQCRAGALRERDRHQATKSTGIL